ncbi:ATP-binding protein [Dechloromonas sp. XY25]|uniref:histidine kinase n=1 Tax=Dechloromonas hankyongensis TaxID=2908002 RepID=A0ABS9K4J0_9RHOO|nr:ATP-binding protein [Dechloromonas hankyongensis]MCG2578000.1 ATP-binding protein [Dechloromonas hankyongensis]
MLSQEAGVLGPQVALLYRNLRIGQIVSILNAGLLVWIGAPYVATEYLAAWATVALVIAALRLVGDRRYRQLDGAQRDAQAAFWRQRAIIGATLGGIAWAGGTVMFMTAGDPIFKLFTAFVMAGMVAGAVQAVAADLTAFRCYAWPVITAVAFCAFSVDSLGIAFTLMSLIFLVAVTRSAQFFNQALHDSIRLEQEQARLAQHLAHARAAAEQSLRAKTEFLSNISHELRTPMNGIIGIADILALDASAEQQELLGHLRQSSDLLMTQINHLIRLSELEAGHVKPKAAPFITAELLSRTIFGHQSQASAKGIALVLDSDPALPAVVVGDSDCLTDALRHLVANAIKFTERGTVSVACRLHRYDGGTAWVEFAVSDTGSGIAPDALKAIKGLLVQADGSSIRRHGGLGVGLAIVRRLVELLGGELRIVSTPGKGSVFSFAIPFALPAEESLADAA